MDKVIQHLSHITGFLCVTVWYRYKLTAKNPDVPLS